MASFAQELKTFLEIAGRVPGVLEESLQRAEAAERQLRGGERAYERTHWGRQHEPAETATDEGVWTEGIPDPRGGVAMLGRLDSVSYITEKGGDREGTIYTHHFGPRASTEQCRACGCITRKGSVVLQALPMLGFTWHEKPSGLVIARDASTYRVEGRGIVG